MSIRSPIACSLSASDYRERLEQIRELGREASVRAVDGGDTVMLMFTHGPDVRARLEQIVAAEAACCPFLHLEVEDREDAITLTIAAPAEAAPFVRDLLVSFQGASK